MDITNKCRLACPKCERYHSDYTEAKNKELSLNSFKNIFPKQDKLLPFYRSLTITFCGNYGDPLYHSELFSVLSYLKELGIKLIIYTNGSGFDEQWWQGLCANLTKEDQIVFSVDGLEDTNHLYRRGANWQQILAGLKVAPQHVQTCWKMIAFSHNEHQFEQAAELAKDLGVQEFEVVKSSRFKASGDEAMKPKNPKWHSKRSTDKFAVIRKWKKSPEDILDHVQIIPACKKGRSLYIDFNGTFHPCCKTAIKRNYKDQTSLDLCNSLLKFDLTKMSWQEVLSDPYWKEIEDSWANSEKVSSICLKRCGTTKENVTSYNGKSMPFKPSEDRIRSKLEKLTIE
jgi:MoaA/NifB/PqqE/SkfB family radical SAM enzyme